MRISGVKPLLILILAALACWATVEALPESAYQSHDWTVGTSLNGDDSGVTVPDTLRDAADRIDSGATMDVIGPAGVLLAGLITLASCTLWLYSKLVGDGYHGGRLLLATLMCAAGWYWSHRMNLLPLKLFFGVPAVVLALATLRPITIIVNRPKTEHHHHTTSTTPHKRKSPKRPAPNVDQIRPKRKPKPYYDADDVAALKLKEKLKP